MILAGDIGGTHARLALYDGNHNGLKLVQREVFVSRNYFNLGEVVKHFIDKYPTQIESVCFGVAGPVAQGTIVTSNLPWIVRRNVLIETLKTQSVWLLNDLGAAAYGIDGLDPEDFFEVNPGKPVKGNRALIFAGTGLGEAMSLRVGDRHFPSPSEGGHSDFSPKTTLNGS